jgi:hypothetical protein
VGHGFLVLVFYTIANLSFEVKMNLKTSFKYSIIVGLVVFSSIARPDMVGKMGLARMAPLHSHKVADVISHFSGKDQNQDVRDLAVLAKDVFEVEEIQVSASDVKFIADWNVLEAIKMKMASQDMWKKKLTPEKLKILNDKKNLLSKNFTPTSVEWAWILFQEGDHPEAKKILRVNFENEYNAVMKLTIAHFGFGRGPLSGLEEAYKGLENLADEKEKASLKEKMKKAKVYVSNLPNANIMT